MIQFQLPLRDPNLDLPVTGVWKTTEPYGPGTNWEEVEWRTVWVSHCPNCGTAWTSSGPRQVVVCGYGQIGCGYMYRTEDREETPNDTGSTD